MNKLHSFMHRLHNTDLGSLFIRIAVGVVFIHAGWLKLSGIEATVTGFATLGIPSFLAYFVAYAEFIGGIAVILGLFVRYFGIVLAIIMLVAAKVHFPNGFGLGGGGYEYTFVLFFSSLALVTLGGGKYSLGKMICKK